MYLVGCQATGAINIAIVLLRMKVALGAEGRKGWNDYMRYVDQNNIFLTLFRNIPPLSSAIY